VLHELSPDPADPRGDLGVGVAIADEAAGVYGWFDARDQRAERRLAACGVIGWMRINLKLGLTPVVYRETIVFAGWLSWSWAGFRR
jgi:hypothetical protein